MSTPRSATGAQLAARDVRYARVEVPDLDGSMRAKLVSVDKALGADGVALCSIAFGLTVADDVYESPASSYANGFPDLWAHGDPATVRLHPDRCAERPAVTASAAPGIAFLAVTPATKRARRNRQVAKRGTTNDEAGSYDAPRPKLLLIPMLASFAGLRRQ